MSIKSISNMIIRTLMFQMLHWVLCITLNPSAAGLGFPFYSSEKLEEKLIIEVGCRLDVGTLPFSHARFLTF